LERAGATMKIIYRWFLSIILIFSVVQVPIKSYAADPCIGIKPGQKIFWEGSELKPGQIGKVSILKDTPLLTLSGKQTKILKKGSSYRIYSFKGDLLGVGGGLYVKRNQNISYKTPSKQKLLAVSCANKPEIPNPVDEGTTETKPANSCAGIKPGQKIYWDGSELKPGQIGKVIILKDTKLITLDGKKIKVLKKGSSYRIYNFKGNLLGVGGGYYIVRDEKITYKTPSKQKLEAVKCANKKTNPYQSIIDKAVKDYKAQNIDYTRSFQEYTATGDYLNYSKVKGFQKSRVKLDENGIPLVLYFNQYQYNPVTIAQYGLYQYGHSLSGDQEAYKSFIKIANYLVNMQDKQGALRYNFYYPSKHLGVNYNPGWVSAMAQGQTLSVFARAYHLTGDTKYLLAGKQNLRFLLTPKEKGGVLTTLKDINPNWKKHIFLEEYVTTPNNYTLNGYMFTLLGLYDWSQIATNEYGKKDALAYFNSGIQSLKLLLPKYDIGGFTAYDLYHITKKKPPHLLPSYHAVHIYELHALYSITKDPVLKSYEKKWASYVD
jgi:hypothetical protein